MIELTKTNLNVQFNYKIKSEAIYLCDRTDIEKEKLESNNDETSRRIGMGFIFLFDSYYDDKDILNFYAEKIIDELIRENSLENMLHQTYNSPEEINKIGIYNFMIEFIYCHDQLLGDYVITNRDLLSGFKIR